MVYGIWVQFWKQLYRIKREFQNMAGKYTKIYYLFEIVSQIRWFVTKKKNHYFLYGKTELNLRLNASWLVLIMIIVIMNIVICLIFYRVCCDISYICNKILIIYFIFIILINFHHFTLKYYNKFVYISEVYTVIRCANWKSNFAE